MLALELDKSTVKAFMGQLLREEIFDRFEVRGVEIATTIHINLDGRLEAAGDGDKKLGFSSWEEMRPIVYAIIKASPKPGYVKIIFSYKTCEVCEIHSNAAALFLNFTYENDNVFFTTGTAQKEFLFEKSLDAAWDKWVKEFLAKANLTVTDRE
jgi:hypothetical protein